MLLGLLLLAGLIASAPARAAATALAENYVGLPLDFAQRR